MFHDEINIVGLKITGRSKNNSLLATVSKVLIWAFTKGHSSFARRRARDPGATQRNGRERKAPESTTPHNSDGGEQLPKEMVDLLRRSLEFVT